MLASPVAAFAQTPPPTSNEERPSVILGGFELRPRLMLHSIGVDNNVFNEPENPKRDFTFGVQPDLEITAKPGPLKIVWLLSTDFLYYKEYESERTANRSLSMNVDATLGPVRPYGSLTLANTSARPSSEIDARAERTPQTVAAGVTVKIATRTNVGVKWAQAREHYDDQQEFRGQELATTLNNETRTLEGSVGIDLTPLTSVSVVVGRDELTFHHEPLRNATATRVLPTVTFNPAGLINGSAAIGYKRFEGDHPSMPNYEGLAMNGSIAVLLGQRYRVESRFARDVQYSYEEALPYYVLTGVHGTLTTQLTSIFDVRLTGGHDRMQYRAYGTDESPGTDRQQVYGGGLGFRVGDHKRVAVQVEFIERKSDRERLREYKNHRIFATLTWGA